MTTEISSQPGIPAYRYPHHLERVLGYSRNYRSMEYRRQVGLTSTHDAENRQGLRLAGLCALLVWALCAWMFFNANFATP